jgi:S-adenosyl-L-methionine hydrolase (adenosine-forming)
VSRIVTLMTDFGAGDPYVGVMKGVMLAVNPELHIVDLTHAIDSYHILGASFLLSTAYQYFPSFTIHLVVVDPGVGGTRRPLAVVTEDQYFIAPDNGVLSHIYLRYPDCVVRHITESHYFLPTRGNTFHGRDVFAPCAAWLSRLNDSSLFGEEITDYVRIPVPQPVQQGLQITGQIIHVDRFGNLVSNIPGEMLGELQQQHASPPPKVRVEEREVGALVNAYGDRGEGQALALVSGTGHLEIAVNRGDARRALALDVGAKVTVWFEEGK